jgi:hypothetical protein
MSKKFEEAKKEIVLDEKVNKLKEKFENDFVALNCEIQQTRSDNETLLDEIKHREDHLRNINREIQEKASLIQLLETKILELKK